jgi:hypothetical protein
MSKARKRATTRQKLIRGAIVSASLLAFVPVFNQMQVDATPTVSVAEVAPAITQTQVSSTTTDAGSSTRTTTQQVTRSHTRTRGS